MDEELFNSVLDSIYDAATSPDLWNVALERLSGFFGCTVATLIERNIKTSQGHGVAVGVDQASQHEFFAVWGSRNPFVQALRLKNPSAIDTDQDILPKNALLISDYYNGFMRQRDMHSLLRFTLQKDENLHQSLSIMGPRSLGEFETSHVAQSKLFMPHLQRAATVTRRLTVATSLMQSVSSALESHPDGVILLNKFGEIITANRVARSMAAALDSFILRGDRIAALRPDDNAKMQRLIAGATGQLQGLHAARGDAMRLARSTVARDYFAVITPLPVNSTLYEKLVPAACIVITDPLKAPPHSPSMLKTFFGLTHTESRMVERLTSGETPEQAGAKLKIGIATVRTHINSIYRKTDVNRQSDLIRLLGRLPWMRP